MVTEAFSRHAPVFVYFSDSHSGSSSNFPSLRRCDAIPPGHFQPFFNIVLVCSHFPTPSGIRFLTSLHDGQWYSLCFSVPSSLLQPLHFFSSDQPRPYNGFCTHPPSTTSFLVTCRCLSIHASQVFLRSIARVRCCTTDHPHAPHLPEILQGTSCSFLVTLQWIFQFCSTFCLIFWSAAFHQLRPQTAPRITRTLSAPHHCLAIWTDSSHHRVISQLRFSPSFQFVVAVFPNLSWALHYGICLRPHATPCGPLLGARNQLCIPLRFKLFTIVQLLQTGCILQSRVNLFFFSSEMCWF